MAEPEDFPSRQEFLRLFWTIVNAPMNERWIEGTIREATRKPDGPFGDMGAVLQRLLALGATRRDLSLLQRMASYEAVFGTLYQLSDQGIAPKDADALYEELLMADPSGLEAGPGSAPASLI